MRRSRTADGDYGQTVRDMNKSHKSNVIEIIFLDFLVPNFFGLVEPPSGQSLFCVLRLNGWGYE